MALIRTEERDNYLILHLEGDYIGGEETDKLREQLKELSVKDKNTVIIDLTDTVFLATPTLGVLLSANAQFTKHKGKIILCNASEYLENIFTITKLTMIFPIYKTLQEAIDNI